MEEIKINPLDEIKSVKIQGNGYLLNGTMSVPKADGNREYELIKLWIAEGNTPEPEYTEAELAELEKAKIPQSITPRQARLALLNAELLDEVDAMLAANREWQIEWEYATVIERSSPLTSAMAMQLNLTDTQIDEMFIEAAQL